MDVHVCAAIASNAAFAATRSWILLDDGADDPLQLPPSLSLTEQQVGGTSSSLAAGPPLLTLPANARQREVFMLRLLAIAGQRLRQAILVAGSNGVTDMGAGGTPHPILPQPVKGLQAPERLGEGAALRVRGSSPVAGCIRDIQIHVCQQLILLFCDAPDHDLNPMIMPCILYLKGSCSHRTL